MGEFDQWPPADTTRSANLFAMQTENYLGINQQQKTVQLNTSVILHILFLILKMFISIVLMHI